MNYKCDNCRHITSKPSWHDDTYERHDYESGDMYLYHKHTPVCPVCLADMRELADLPRTLLSIAGVA